VTFQGQEVRMQAKRMAAYMDNFMMGTMGEHSF